MLKVYSKKIFSYCVGMLLLAFGVTFSIKSNLGVSPINSIPYVLSLITEIDQGLLTTIVFSIFILMQTIILRKDFKIINLLQIIFSSAFGSFVTLSNNIWTFQAPTNYIMRLIILVVSMVLVALGLLFYLAADIVPMPAEGVMLAIQIKTKKEFAKIKVVFDTSVVIIASILSMILLGNLIGVREGTLIAAIGIGKILGVLKRKYNSYIVDFINKETDYNVSEDNSDNEDDIDNEDNYGRELNYE